MPMCANSLINAHMSKPKSSIQIGTGAEVREIAGIVTSNLSAVTALQEARNSGLLVGEKDAHVSFRAPRALVEAAMRRSGVKGMTDVGTIALAMLALEDPVAGLMKATRGALGPDHTLEY